MTNGTASGFDTIESALEALRNGEFIIAVDNEDRENEGDLIIAGEFATDEKMAFMIRYSSGLICVAMPGDRLDKLELPLMVANNQDSYRTAYTISVDLATGTSTGISSGDRARTIAALANPSSVAADFNRPGHVFPLRAREGGVLTRVGHTEASVDFGMARRDELRGMARRWGVKMVTIADLVKYRIENGFGEGW
ncbi:DHBP synthase RibB-like alpha/beta domain-containing protein [Chytridium lagenaria]|nr:DHBP synthase RibB-like alpha/beta domain-containing protein [Chytridium lagenaria]